MRPSTIRTPSGWKSPEAIRCQVSSTGTESFSSSRDKPVTFQTSPSQSLTAIESPSSKKSNPVNRTRANHGLFDGAVSTSTANGPSSEPRCTVVFSRSGHRAGPPCIRCARSTVGWITRTVANDFDVCALPAKPVDRVHSRNASGSSPAGIVRHNRLSSISDHWLPGIFVDRPAAIRTTGATFGLAPFLATSGNLPAASAREPSFIFQFATSPWEPIASAPFFSSLGGKAR